MAGEGAESSVGIPLCESQQTKLNLEVMGRTYHDPEKLSVAKASSVGGKNKFGSFKSSRMSFDLSQLPDIVGSWNSARGCTAGTVGTEREASAASACSGNLMLVDLHSKSLSVPSRS